MVDQLKAYIMGFSRVIYAILVERKAYDLERGAAWSSLVNVKKANIQDKTLFQGKDLCHDDDRFHMRNIAE